jgi:uncharacterized PurR-regulated membrane protein YhhQ (DUF165 family)
MTAQEFSMVRFAMLVYVLAMVAANFIVAALGPKVSPVLAFVFIGLDLALRDWLHVKLDRPQMAGLIIVAALASWVLNPAAGQIALASAVAFGAAAMTDWWVFSRVRGAWMFRANVSNTAGAAVDSLIFPTLAFGSLMPEIVLMQFVAKVLGGALWARLLSSRLG